VLAISVGAKVAAGSERQVEVFSDDEVERILLEKLWCQALNLLTYWDGPSSGFAMAGAFFSPPALRAPGRGPRREGAGGPGERRHGYHTGRQIGSFGARHLTY